MEQLKTDISARDIDIGSDLMKEIKAVIRQYPMPM
jgi:hypothetical protein